MIINGLNHYWWSKGIIFDFFGPINPLHPTSGLCMSATSDVGHSGDVIGYVKFGANPFLPFILPMLWWRKNRFPWDWSFLSMVWWPQKWVLTLISDVFHFFSKIDFFAVFAQKKDYLLNCWEKVHVHFNIISRKF